MPSEPDGRTDVELAEAHEAGDPGAFAELYRRHRDRVFRLALTVTCDRELAADVTQDVFLKLHTRLGSFEGRAKFTTWLHRVALNACHDQLRRRRPDPLPEEAEAALADDERTGEVTDRITLLSALSLLPEEFRTVVVLHDLYDHRYEEISELLGIPMGTVKSRLARGRLRLSESLGHESGTGSDDAPLGNNPDPSGRPNDRTTR